MDSFSQPSTSDSPTVLLVDDEAHVVSSLRRSLKPRGYRILATHGGLQALEILEQHDVDLLICDSRMPGMDGPAFLAQAQRRWPDTMRIMLTAYADMDAVVSAINEGKIYRYINKPWDDAELGLAIEQALAYRRVDRERIRLQKITQEQNLALQDANATLETRVRERTEELARAAEKLQIANDNLHRNYVTATEVFSSLINMRLPPSRQTNQQVITLVRAFCHAQELPQDVTDDIAIAAAFYNLGKLTWNDALIALPPEKMEKTQRERYRGYPLTGESLLMALEPAQEAARLIRHHQERWDGAGFPDELAGRDIPLGSRILKMAVDYVEMQMGMVLSRKLTPEEVLAGMPKYAGRLYDPDLCPKFVEVAMKLEQGDAGDGEVLVLNSMALEPGMLMLRDLHAASGTLLLKGGTVLTEKLIDKLQLFEHNEGSAYSLHVRRPDDELVE